MRILNIPIGSLWRRSEIHDLLGGQRQGGISTPAGKPYIILFSSSRGAEYGYQDGWDNQGFYRYTGEGQLGDMTFTRGNKAIRDHAKNGKVLLLFETTKDNLRRFVGTMAYAGHSFEQLPDQSGKMRSAIVFKLVPVDASTAFNVPVDIPSSHDALCFLASRKAALDASRPTAPTASSTLEYRKRSDAVARYVLQRASGYCEICGRPAPFKRADGSWYLETHHLKQLADDGPDAPEDVAASCPTCHKRIHHGVDGKEINQKARIHIRAVEHAIAAGRFALVTAAIIKGPSGRILVAQRNGPGTLHSKWEFPGGKVEPGESLEACLQRELMEELSVRIDSPTRFFMVDHTYEDVHVRLCAMNTRLLDTKITLNAHRSIRWVRPEELLSLDLAPADIEVAKALKDEF